MFILVAAPPVGSPLTGSNTTAAASALAYDDSRGEHDPLRILNRSSSSPDVTGIHGYDDPANLAQARTGAFALGSSAESRRTYVRFTRAEARLR